MSEQTSLPIAVIGAGPIGLAAAAHIVERGETPLVFESAETIAGSVLQWSHVRMFSPWRYNIDGAAQAILQRHSWQAPDLDQLPTGGELYADYLQPLAATPELNQHILLNARVTAVSRRRIDKMKDFGRENAPFVIAATVAGREKRFEARAVIDTSGNWLKPNPLGSDGLPAIGEKAAKDKIFYGIPDVLGQHRSRYVGQTIAVVGGGHSAINAILELNDLNLDEPGGQIHWILRKPSVSGAYGGLGDDALPGRGMLGLRIKELVDAGVLRVHTPWFITEVEVDGDRVTISAETPTGAQQIEVNEIITATGSRPDLSMLAELRLGLDPSVESPTKLAPLIDPNIHSCGTVRPHGEADLRHPEENFYIAGMKSYGRAPTFLLATGYEQVRSIVAHLTGDFEAAKRVELCLPETGVCGVPAAVNANANECCTPTESADACCVESAALAQAEVACCTPTPEADACCTPAKLTLDTIQINVN